MNNYPNKNYNKLSTKLTKSNKTHSKINKKYKPKEELEELFSVDNFEPAKNSYKPDNESTVKASRTTDDYARMVKQSPDRYINYNAGFGGSLGFSVGIFEDIEKIKEDLIPRENNLNIEEDLKNIIDKIINKIKFESSKIENEKERSRYLKTVFKYLKNKLYKAENILN